VETHTRSRDWTWDSWMPRPGTRRYRIVKALCPNASKRRYALVAVVLVALALAGLWGPGL